MGKLIVIEMPGCDVVVAADSAVAQNKAWLDRYHVDEFEPDDFTGLVRDFESSDGMMRHARR